jgi:enamine deaminase RidA (YjgF/YER057c/UK114 family)
MSKKQLINPPELATPRGYTHGILTVGGRLLFLGGQDASDAEGRIVAAGDIVAQYEQAVKNLQAVVAEAGGQLTDIVKLNIYATDRALYRAHLNAIGKVHRAHFGDYYPTMAFFEVKSLFQDEALIELEGMAQISDP